MLECCTLGTGGTLPLANRALSSLYIRENGPRDTISTYKRFGNTRH